MDGGDNIGVNTDGTFLYTGKVPFNTDTEAATGSLTWSAIDATDSTAGAPPPRRASPSRSGR